MNFTYPKNLCFECNKCGLCCGDTAQKTRRILLLPQEVKDIAKATNQSANNFTAPIEGNQPYLFEIQKTDGKCVFLKNNQCTIYQHRPLICRFYPFELKTQKNQQVFNVTLECPAINRGQRIDRKYFCALFKLAREKLES